MVRCRRARVYEAVEAEIEMWKAKYEALKGKEMVE